MGWDVAKQVAEVTHTFERAIPSDAGVAVRIAKVRPGANAIMEQTLSEATLVYRAGAVEQRQTVHWELVKFTACWLTHIEAVGLEKNGEPLFPVRRKASQEVAKADFARAWNELLPPEISDEWMAAVLRANPLWYDLLRLWIPLWWLRAWMPEKLETVEDETEGEVQPEPADGAGRSKPKKERAARGEPLGEGLSE